MAERYKRSRLEIRALDVATNESYLVAFADYDTRNATNGVSLVSGGFSTYTWDGKRLFTNAAGKVHRKELPDGGRLPRSSSSVTGKPVRTAAAGGRIPAGRP
ncbi:MAG TPA: hypothetical protein VMN39_05495, partial [Longimicrobiaceae bacterium]|nr:hypothetical protein [Longimicrobiaceae bacterium]